MWFAAQSALQVMEAALLAALTAQTQQLILIGDHKQLRPKTQEYSLSVDSGRKYKLDVSMFERIAQQEEPPAPVVTLSTQRRMHPCISSLIKVPSLYPDLLDSERVGQYPQVRGMRDRLFFWDHDNREAGEEEATGVAGVLTGSKQNAGEAAMVVALARYLLQQGYKPDELAIITPYVGQLKAIRALLSKARPLSSHARHLPLSAEAAFALPRGTRHARSLLRLRLVSSSFPRLRRAHPQLTISTLVDDRDEELIEKTEEAENKEGDGGAADSGGGGDDGAAASQGRAVEKSATECLRLATVDNFQARLLACLCGACCGLCCPSALMSNNRMCSFCKSGYS